MRAVREIVASAAILALAAISGCAQKAAPMTAAIPMDMPSLAEVGLHQDWSRSIHLEPGESVRKAWRVGVSVYVATSHSRIIRIDAQSGVLVWSDGLGPENFDIFRPIEVKGPDNSPAKDVLVVTGGEAFTLDMETGDEAQVPSQLGISVSTNPVLVGNTLCVGGASAFYGLYLDRMDLRHWNVPARGDLFVSTPVAIDNNVLVASRAGHLWRISTDTGDWDWKDRKTNGDVVAGLAADYNAVYVPCMDQRVYAFAADTGMELWEQQLDSPLETTPALAGPHVLVISHSRTLFALTRLTGEIKWHIPDATDVAAIEDDAVWVGDSAGNLKLIAVDDGSQRATIATPGIQIFIPNRIDNHVILVGQGGVVASYSPSR